MDSIKIRRVKGRITDGETHVLLKNRTATLHVIACCMLINLSSRKPETMWPFQYTTWNMANLRHGLLYRMNMDEVKEWLSSQTI